MGEQHCERVSGEMADGDHRPVDSPAVHAGKPVGLALVEDDGHDEVTSPAAQVNKHRCVWHRARRPAHQAAACLAEVAIGLRALTVTITP
jgi:hypothetical protein